MQPTRTALATVVATTLVFTTILMAKPARFITLDYPGATATYARGINPAGDIVGGWGDSLGHVHGFVLKGDVFTSIDWPHSCFDQTPDPDGCTTWTEAWGINPRGDIVGQYGWLQNGENTIHGFLLSDGELHAVDVAGQQNTMPVRINAEGTIVGCYHANLNAGGATNLDTMYGFAWDAAGVTPHSMNRTMNNGVNPNGAIVGTYFSPTTGLVEASYLIQGDATTWIEFPESAVTQAWDISANGMIVGWHRTAMTGPNQFHGFVMEKGVMTSLDRPGASDTRAFGVNPRGDIVGFYRDGTGAHGFLLSRRGPK